MVTWLLCAGTPFWRYSSSFSSNLAFLVVAPALLALSSLGIVVLQPLCGKGQQQANSCSSLTRLLPSRHFWQQTWRGLTMRDWAVLCFLAAVNIIWAAAQLTDHWQQLLLKAASEGLSTPSNAMIFKMLAKSFASLLAPHLVLLLYPISRGSVVLQALRLPYPEAIR
ncbi:hypothetical protein OEZ86_004546 [Tetradesmus obliquus]|nr:hypothetical protein OEZ86_004546 [Tetradesmus obliquus]